MSRPSLLASARLTLPQRRGQLWVSRRFDQQSRCLAFKARQRRDNFWIPTVSLKRQDETSDVTQLLIRAGYLRQAYSGIYHLLPLGLRVQEKLEKLIDKHMRSINASKVSLSSISSQALWERSGRLSTGSELFKFSDRKDAKWLLSPTHEEEITNLVADVVHTPGQLPIRLYQISRKYRDEKRPRGGLLRGREFTMKDLYTFDISQNEAHITYDNVRQAYRNFLDELKLNYVEARADSGNMGGKLSHEYHFPNPAGEDDVISCDSCDYARNEEWVPECGFEVQDRELADVPHEAEQMQRIADYTSIDLIDTTHARLVRVFAPLKQLHSHTATINTYAVKAALKGLVELDTGVEQAQKAFIGKNTNPGSPERTVYYLFDPSIGTEQMDAVLCRDSHWLADNKLNTKVVVTGSDGDGSFSLLKQLSGDPCPQCQPGTLTVSKAIEVGHTFHLGTRYSSTLGLTVKRADDHQNPIPVEMGCHGIGVSRLVAAIAASLSDKTGLNWPRVIAPFEAVVVVDGNDVEKSDVAAKLYDSLLKDDEETIDTLIDDRTSVNNGYKLKDADLIGYPVIIVIGKTWAKSGQVEVQCRRLALKENVNLENVSERVRQILAQL